MKIRGIKVLAAIVAVVVSCGLLTPPRGAEAASGAGVAVWTAPATSRIMRDESYEPGAAALSIELCKNEVEGGQVILSTDGVIGDIRAEATELTGPDGAKIPKERIAIYFEKYINVYINATSNPYRKTGYHPDALLPMEKAIEYGENKTTGKNQGLYVTVKTEADTPAGTYTGSINLTLDGAAKSVPVSVKVWDFAISDETHSRSLFAIWDDQLMLSELDSTKQMRQAYIDALKTYRLSPDRLAFETEEEFVAQAKAATADPTVTCYVMPYRGAPNRDPNFPLGGTLDFDYHLRLLRLLAEASDEELILFDKLVYYPGALYDEPQFDQSGNMDLQIIYVANRLDQMEADLFASLESEGYFSDKSAAYKERFRAALLGIPNLVTGPYEEDYPDGVTYCPLFDEFEEAEKRDRYAAAKARNGEVWWYGCTGPNYPYVTYHIDDNLVGARILNYMMYDYGIDGNLYWAVNYSLKAGAEAGDIARPVDAYTEVRRSSAQGAINGDGYLFYPGVDYGMSGPVGSMRLEAIRDGIEEYEYLYRLGEIADDLAGYYGTEVSGNEMVSSLYKRLYGGVKYVPDEENYFEVRRSLAEMVERVDGPEKFVAREVVYEGASAKLDFFVADGYAVEVNGTPLAGSGEGLRAGKRYTAVKALDEPSNRFIIRLSKDGRTTEYEIFLGGRMSVAADFDEAADVNLISANDGAITLAYNPCPEHAVSGGSVRADIVSKFDPDDPFATLTYYPELSFDGAKLGFTVSSLDQFSVMVYNASEADVTMTAYLCSPAREYKLTTFTLRRGQWNAVTLEGLYRTNFVDLDKVDRIMMRLSNTVRDENLEAMPEQILYFDNLIVGEKSV